MEEQTIDIPRQTHEAISPVEATSGGGNRGVDESSLKHELYRYATYAFVDMWPKARAIYDIFPDMVRIPLTVSGDTALHVAVMQNNSTFVKELVHLEYMTPKDLEIPNADGNTAFCRAAIEGKGNFLQIMKEKNQNLPVIPGQDGMLPVHLAVLFGYHNIAQDLTSLDLLQRMDLKDIERLFFMTINSSMYDVASKLLQSFPEHLVVARYDEENLTALHMLARKHSEESYMREKNSNVTSSELDHRLTLLQTLCRVVSTLEDHQILELITHPSVVLFDAVESGNIEVVKFLVNPLNPELLLTIKDPGTGRNLLHFAVCYRRYGIFNLILNMRKVKDIIRAVDFDGNNVLHFAAYQPEETSSLRSIGQKQRELAWFKEVEKRVPPELRTMRNKDGKTPKDIYYANHKQLSYEVKEATKVIANSSGMVVATLIATVAFAAALMTGPGDKTSAWFIVFILTNAVALFTSAASIITFLSISTSERYAKGEFDFFFQRPSFILGLTYISIANMIIAFVAASFLIFDHIYKWVAYVVALLALLPILTFLGIQVSLFGGLRKFYLRFKNYLLYKVAGM